MQLAPGEYPACIDPACNRNTASVRSFTVHECELLQLFYSQIISPDKIEEQTDGRSTVGSAACLQEKQYTMTLWTLKTASISCCLATAMFDLNFRTSHYQPDKQSVRSTIERWSAECRAIIDKWNLRQIKQLRSVMLSIRQDGVGRSSEQIDKTYLSSMPHVLQEDFSKLGLLVGRQKKQVNGKRMRCLNFFQLHLGSWCQKCGKLV